MSPIRGKGYGIMEERKRWNGSRRERAREIIVLVFQL
jgi:hypothetical protein